MVHTRRARVQLRHILLVLCAVALFQRSLRAFQLVTSDNDPVPMTMTMTATSILHVNWQQLSQPPLYTPLAAKMRSLQQDCRSPVSTTRLRNRFGMGSELHVWAVALCEALERQQRLRAFVFQNEAWIWNDGQVCSQNISSSPLNCYFAVEPACPGDAAVIAKYAHNPLLPPTFRIMEDKQYNVSTACLAVTAQYGVPALRAAATEVLFRSVRPVVIREAEQQATRLFGRRSGGAPRGMITVHIRWGDKKYEARLIKITRYIAAVQQLLDDRQHNHDAHANDTVHVLVATEDPRAVQAFRRAAPSHWHLYVDDYVTQFGAVRQNRTEYNNNPHIARQHGGKPGLVSLASLLVALEAEAFVLTTMSNWSRLINELRRNVLEPYRRLACDAAKKEDCGWQLPMVDLYAGEW